MNALVVIEVKDLTPAIFSDHDAIDKIVAEIEAKVRATPVDISTVKGRKECKALAFKIARSKTAVDDMGKKLVSGLKSQSKLIDVERARIWDRLEALQAEVRKPLDEFEAAEDARIAAHQNVIQAIVDLGFFICEPPPSAEIITRLRSLGDLPDRDWQEFKLRAAAARSETFAKLTALKDGALKREAEIVELERLRAEQAARERQEREDAIAAAAAEKARREAETKAAAEAAAVAENARAALQAAEDARQAAICETERAENERQEAQRRAEAAEAARIEQIAAAERARINAELKAIEDAKAAATKAERDAKDAAEAAERHRLQAIEDERQRVADQEAVAAAETKRREEDKMHRRTVNTAAAAALITAGLTKDQAVIAITAIAMRKVPAVRIEY